MRILRVFPRRTSFTPDDALAFVGDPPLFRPATDGIHISAAFTWDIAYARRLQAAWQAVYPDVCVQIGGPALAKLGQFHHPFEPGIYVKPGVTFTTRGCGNKCRWCLVPQREGLLTMVSHFAPGHIIQDNNLLQASREHVRRVFEMLRSQRQAAVFSGGLQADLVDDWVALQLSGLRIHEVFLAADTQRALKPLETAIRRLSFLNRRQLRVYVLIGYGGETIPQAAERLEAVWQAGGLPFAQLYQPADRWIEYPREWRQLARAWSRPAIMFAQHLEE